MNGTVYDYYYVDSRLVYEKREDFFAFFYSYDSNSNIALIRRVILPFSAFDCDYAVANAWATSKNYMWSQQKKLQTKQQAVLFL